MNLLAASFDDFIIGQKFLKKCVAAIEARGLPYERNVIKYYCLQDLWMQQSYSEIKVHGILLTYAHVDDHPLQRGGELVSNLVTW